MQSEISPIDVGSSRERAHGLAIRRAAEALLKPSPDWLVDVLSDFSWEVGSQHSIDEMSLSKEELSSLVSSAQSQTLALHDAMRGPLAGHVALQTPSMTEEFQEQLALDLQRYYNALGTTKKTMTDEKGHLKSGRGKTHLLNTKPARYVCAAIIAEAGAFLTTNRFSAPKKTAMYDSATYLWTSLLPIGGWGSSRQPSWRHYFEAAADPSLDSLRREVHRQLAIRLGDTAWRK
ncbi:hypothetical protein IVB33_17180 [Bradyrhizobium sp. 24]|uniref:hypothetical protein n=1 Tax=unclassified Bradyrhizobium TaxID=2631580 RepID=UPI001FF76F88|nr:MULTISPECIES: hypothetical protein [unclassified Bradyrhizobium]MCK1303788.1 hypothetical protein [Bradyrhizobium sp. 37]MCK1379351.1 hypothetical protein [Bradyrhizobium sp. 24]MCK1770306.1 hypothetical protein [Bradyrhizobium sp. 134]